MKDKVTTSRGQLAEAEEVVMNLLAAADHLIEVGDYSDMEGLMNDIRVARQQIMDQYLPEDINTDYHCMYKHLLLAQMEYRELMQAKSYRALEQKSQFNNLLELEVNRVALTHEEYLKEVKRITAERYRNHLQEPIINDLQILSRIKVILGIVRARYFNIPLDQIEDPSCPRCVEDYLLNKKNETDSVDENTKLDA